MEYTRHPEAREKVIEMTMKDIARELAEGLTPYMEFTEEFDPMRMTTIIGGKVKIADIKHNLDTTRMNGIKSPKYNLYLQALDYLERKNYSELVF